MSTIECLVQALEQMPLTSWERVVEREPEQRFLDLALRLHRWEEALPLSLLAGLNDYRPACRVEKCYWPPLEQVLMNAGGNYRDALEDMSEFFQTQPQGLQKVSRMRRFLQSRLYWEIVAGRWPPSRVLNELEEFWRRLGEAMRQKPEAKTISFAVKIAVLLARRAVGNKSGPPPNLTIPVDSRVTTLTQCLTGRKVDEGEVRSLWDRVLEQLRRTHPTLTMVELDSLAWQLAARIRQGRASVVDYFRELGAPQVWWRLERCLGSCLEEM